MRLTVRMPGPSLYVARVEPYRLSDLGALLESIRPHPRVHITPIGKTVEGRDLEIVGIGDAAAPYRVFVRARAHPWESGGNWVVQGLIRRLLKDDADAQKFLQRYSVWILPMANKDGVARGRSRFNLLGMDLSRDWDRPADPGLAPENAALQRWLEGMIAAGRRPHLALDLHNSGGGQLLFSRTPGPELNRYLERMAVFEKLLRRYTWFTEGAAANVPIFKGGQIRADVRTAYSLVRQAQQYESLTQRQVDEEVKVAYENLRTSQERLNELRTESAAARDAFGLAEQAYHVGLATNLERLVAQDLLQEAELQVAAETLNGKILYFRLVETIGQLVDQASRLTEAAAPTPPAS